MTKRTPFHVTAYPGDLLGKFTFEASALRVAQMWSERWQSWAEVSLASGKGAGLIGQFDKGQPTAEFEHTRDICWPAGEQHSPTDFHNLNNRRTKAQG